MLLARIMVPEHLSYRINQPSHSRSSLNCLYLFIQPSQFLKFHGMQPFDDILRQITVRMKRNEIIRVLTKTYSWLRRRQFVTQAIRVERMDGGGSGS